LLRIQNEILRMIADGERLDETARQLCERVEAALPGLLCSILTVDRAGLMNTLAAPSLPDAYNSLLRGKMIGPDAGSCGTAAYTRELVVVRDIHADDRFAKFVLLLDGLGLQSCWSFPVIDPEMGVVAIMAIYGREERGPSASERETIEGCLELCAMALRRHERVVDRERRAYIDALTGLPNRAAFAEALGNMRCDVPGSWALFILDLDNLKIVNDTFGHLAGDALIRTAATRISNVMAPDVTFRLGGDEFAVLLQGAQALADLGATASTIFRELEAPALCDGHSVVPRATIGGAVLSASETTASAVSEAADFALYHAKETGRGGFVRYWPGIGTKIIDRRDAIRDVADALADQRIEAHYQPIVRLDTCEIVGLEALCRMRRPDGELVPAHLFHEATTDAKVAAELTRRMVGEIAKDIAFWRDQGLALSPVGLNVSSVDFYTGSLAKKLGDAFGRAGVPLDLLQIEVSEDVYIGRRDRVVAREIESLRAAGVRVALDDFGTGFGSLTHLLNVPIDTIKIDQTFVARLWPDDPSMVIVEGLIEIARRLDIGLIAVGVETEVQASQLWSMGCKLAQGFAFARPDDREATATLLRRHGKGTHGVSPLFADKDRDRQPSRRVRRQAVGG
jgi:diguanylate cyclase (GGDEF)-like protein